MEAGSKTGTIEMVQRLATWLAVVNIGVDFFI